jgi:hypothetical protein
MRIWAEPAETVVLSHTAVEEREVEIAIKAEHGSCRRGDLNSYAP